MVECCCCASVVVHDIAAVIVMRVDWGPVLKGKVQGCPIDNWIGASKPGKSENNRDGRVEHSYE